MVIATIEAAVVVPGDAAEFGVEAEVDPLRHRDLQQPVADRGVIAAQDHVGAVDSVTATSLFTLKMPANSLAI